MTKRKSKIDLSKITGPQLAERLKEYKEKVEKKKLDDNYRVKTPYCIALGHLYERRNKTVSAIEMIEQMRDTYLIEENLKPRK